LYKPAGKEEHFTIFGCIKITGLPRVRVELGTHGEVKGKDTENNYGRQKTSKKRPESIFVALGAREAEGTFLFPNNFASLLGQIAEWAGQ
jgi:hypothetical protein